MPLSRTPLGILLLLAVGASGCQEAELEGSLQQLIDLHYTSISVLLTDDATSLSFNAKQGSGENTVLEVSADVSDLQVAAHGIINLAEQVESGGQRGVVTRNVLNDPHRTFPTILRGTLVYDSLPTPGQKVSGSFTVTFNECTDFACGYTVYDNNFVGEVPNP